MWPDFTGNMFCFLEVIDRGELDSLLSQQLMHSSVRRKPWAVDFCKLVFSLSW